ncbi:MAG: hypothetical protein J1F02_05260 [Lachnospiraceae bacterium]|nr:hypothetical protein [Lachnospiraceae bacterium]
MPWCPKCRNEYVEGITTCVDCGVELVDELPEEIAPDAPVTLCQVKDKETGAKFIAYLNYGGIQTAGLLPEEDGTLQLVVAQFEKEAADKMFADFSSMDELAEKDISELIPDIEKQLEELQSEEANAMFSELRTEASSVYVKKKDKYTDLKFSGVSFIIFGILGFGLLALNILGVVSLFNKFSTLIMALVFVVFFVVGITSLLRAKKLKNIVSEEEKATDKVLDWVDENITDERIASLFDSELSEEDNYFQVHSQLCQMVAEEFPLFSKGYIDQLMDERYNAYCENKDRD